MKSICFDYHFRILLTNSLISQNTIYFMNIFSTTDRYFELPIWYILYFNGNSLSDSI